ncbi:MAG: poly-gamma-glutamate synthesis protein (capsule biosynthesis protein) [Candidatus Paceibacteria bacterium]|jgi:poly-gamma-glutamate synthesis protein (capsule biosynthesis protein)
MKKVLIFVLILLVVFFTWLGYSEYSQTKKTVLELNKKLMNTNSEVREVSGLRANVQKLETELLEKEAREKIYTILAGGDLMLDRGVEGKIKKLGKDYNFTFDLIREDLQVADLVFANLEGSISDVGVDTGKAYSFRFEPAVAEALAGAGIDIVSIANNHMLDWGRESLCQTTQHLTNFDINYVGAGCETIEAERPQMVTLGDTAVAFLAYTEFYIGAHATSERPGMSEYDMKKITQRIKELKENTDVDIVMVSMHWGEEYKKRATNNQVDLGQQLVDAGADVVIGHHPHVAQEIERYKDGWIIYSLGNFVFDQSFSEETMRGLLVEIQVQDGGVYGVTPVPIQLNENYQPFIIQEQQI